jgi:predicted DNA-binding transcriptional regulator AlpA
MTGNIQHIDQATYLRGFSLWESLFQFGPPNLVADFPRTDELSKSNINPNPNDHIGVQLMGLIGGSIQEYQNYKTKRDNIIKALQQDILNQIKMGDLIPFGFKEPRDISDLPIQIPGDLLFSGVLNWENGNLKYKNYEFSGVRLLADLMPVINSKAVYTENEIEDIAGNKENTGILQIPNLKNSNSLNQNKKTNLKLSHKNKSPNDLELKSENNKFHYKLPDKNTTPNKSKKQSFSDLDPALHIDEKKAAEYLGISHKTLQGYRVKGGGPPFIKVGERSVRYKIADLINWAENRKKKNTSE